VHLTFSSLVKGHKAIPGDKGDVYRLLISDGKYSYAYGMLPGSQNHLIEGGQLENFTIIKAKRCAVNKVATTATAGKGNRKLLFFMDIEPLVAGNEVCLIGFISRLKSKLLFS
jgi:hypothetical protein